MYAALNWCTESYSSIINRPPTRDDPKSTFDDPESTFHSRNLTARRVRNDDNDTLLETNGILFEAK